jgi:hypothetical protein
MTYAQELATNHPVDASHPENGGRSKGVPIYFECSLDRSRVFYEKLGFKTLGCIRVGKGEVDEHGERMKDGVGTRLWALVWWPDGCWPEGVEYWDGKREMDVK